MKAKTRSAVAETVGWYGTIAILAAYAAISFRYLGPTSTLYQLLNLTGAAAIVFIAYRKKAYEPAALNTFWFAVALIALARIFL